jgi:alkylhydroperoxidase family enzyme
MSIRYAGARQAGLTEGKIAALDTLESAIFTDRERVAIRFAELMATDHLKIDDAFFEALRRHFSDAEIVELGVSVALNVGLGRLNAVLGIEPG